MPIPTLTTPRLSLRPFTSDDLYSFHQLLNGPDVLRYFPSSEPLSVAQVEKMLDWIANHWQERSYGLWALQDRSTGDLIGRCGLSYIGDTNEVEIDFILGHNFWGKGLATEAGQATIRFGFEVVDCMAIVGIVHPDNQASQRVLEKLGLRMTRPDNYFGMDCLRYEMLKSE